MANTFRHIYATFKITFDLEPQKVRFKWQSFSSAGLFYISESMSRNSVSVDALAVFSKSTDAFPAVAENLELRVNLDRIQGIGKNERSSGPSSARMFRIFLREFCIFFPAGDLGSLAGNAKKGNKNRRLFTVSQIGISDAEAAKQAFPILELTVQLLGI